MCRHPASKSTQASGHSLAKAAEPENTRTRTVKTHTTMTDSTESGVGDRDAIQSDSYFTDLPVESHGTAVLRHYRFHTTDPDAARRFLGDAYTPGWRIDGLAPRAAVTQRRCDTGLITVDEVRIDGRARCDIRATDHIVVIRPLGGSMSVLRESPERVDYPLLVAHGLPCVLQTNAVRLAVVGFDAKPAAQGGRGTKRAPSAADRVPEFLVHNHRPSCVPGIKRWKYVGATFACDKTAQRPLIVGGSLNCWSPRRSSAPRRT